MSNIVNRGYDWFLDEVKDEYSNWHIRYPHLMRSLKELAFETTIKYPFEYTNHKQETVKFPYVLVWTEDFKVYRRISST